MLALRLAQSLGSSKGGGGTPVIAEFIFSVNTANAGSLSTQFQLPLRNELPMASVDVDWGDGTSDTITTPTQAEALHTYASSGTYTIQITNEVQRWEFLNGGDKLKILDISNWGGFNFTERNTFMGCSNLTSSATDIPIVSQQYFQRTFMYCTSFDGDVSGWDITSSDSIRDSFRGVTAFTGIGLDTWDVSGVNNINSTLREATNFDQDLSSWDITSVNNMGYFLYKGTLSTGNYDALLVSWEAQAPQMNQSPHFGYSKYSAGSTAATARASLISNYGWTITDGGSI